jgi:thioredoxin 1
MPNPATTLSKLFLPRFGRPAVGGEPPDRCALSVAIAAALLFIAIPPAPVAAQVLRDPAASFEPLERWKSAVQAGDRTALKNLYISAPQAYAIIPQGKITDPADEESEFWSKLRAGGLSAINAKILQLTQPQPGIEQLGLRIELTFQSKGVTRREFLSGVQLWAMRGDSWGILISQRSEFFPSPEFRLPEPAIPDLHLYPDPEEAPGDLKEALAAAKTDGKRVLVVFGANWCYDCHILNEAMMSANVAPLVAANYHVVHINIGDGQSNSDLAERFHVPLNKGIPSIAVLDGNGDVVTSQKQGEFESAAKIGMSDITDFLERWKPAAGK